MLPQAVSDHYEAQQRLTVATLALTRREWARMGEDFDASWREVGPRLLLLTASAQVGAARSGAAYVPASLEQVGAAAEPVGTVVPEAFAGIASDGRPLDSLLYGAVTTAKDARTAQSTEAALAAGGKWLDMAVHTMVADAARSAASVAIAARPKTGWIRMVNPPCCQRCAVLAGKHFKWNQGFQRHPRCDCRHIPYAESDPFDPGINIGPEDVKDLTRVQRQAIADGADMNQVINSRRGRSKDGMTTTEGATRRGVAGKALGAGRGQRAKRLTPEGIYRTSASREEAIELLRQNGYLL